jgi:sugar/nucleoside kinase (ribokinase family)
MLRDPRALIRASNAPTFHVICAGEARWDMGALGASRWVEATSFRFRPGGSAVTVSVALARRGLRVGLAAALGDDSLGRALLSRVTAAGVDTAGVSLTASRAGLVFVDGAGLSSSVVGYKQEAPPISIPEGWASQVLLLSGASPVVAQAAAFCKAARSARRAGTVVVVDVNARPHLWLGQDTRMLRAVMSEADVVSVSAADLAVLGVETAALRAMMRQESVLMVTGPTRLRATGPFGEIALDPAALGPSAPPATGDAFTVAICAELARVGAAALGRTDVWERVLQRRPVPTMERAPHL